VKLLCEFKRDSAQNILIGCAPRNVGQDHDYLTVQTHAKRIEHAVNEFSEVFGKLFPSVKILRWEIIRRLSRKENIGAVLVTVEKIGGAA